MDFFDFLKASVSVFLALIYTGLFLSSFLVLLYQMIYCTTAQIIAIEAFRDDCNVWEDAHNTQSAQSNGNILNIKIIK